MTPASPSEMMIIAAARALKSSDVCFVGIGAPSAACNLARLTHAPTIASGFNLMRASIALGAIAVLVMNKERAIALRSMGVNCFT